MELTSPLSSKNGLSATGNKPDLIARILASPEAVAAFQVQDSPNGNPIETAVPAKVAAAPSVTDDDLVCTRAFKRYQPALILSTVTQLVVPPDE